MKWIAALVLAGLMLLIAFGAPFGERAERAFYYGSPEPILPMTFAHKDHQSVQCTLCHHNYVDDSGMDTCMSCHVTDATLWPKLESQFHALCRECHVDKAAHGEAGGPARACLGCHVIDPHP